MVGDGGRCRARPRGGGARRRPGRRGGTRRSGAMSAAAVRVSPAWLELREPADAAARSEALAGVLARSLPATGGLVIHDLGGGSGSMGRWLAPRLPGPQHWVVHDRDADLLELVTAPQGATLETRWADVTRLD